MKRAPSSQSQANVIQLASKMTMTVRVGCALVVGLAETACAQGVNVPRDTIIHLQRTSCLGTCPVYTVTIDARGTVTYVGERSVRVVGRRTAQIAPSVVATLLARAERIRFFDMRDAYRVIEYPNGSVSSPPTSRPRLSPSR